MSMYTIFSSHKPRKSVSPVDTDEDTNKDKSLEKPTIQEPPPPLLSDQQHADEQVLSHHDNEDGYFSFPVGQRRLSLTDLQNEAIYSFGARLSVISEASKEESVKRLNSSHQGVTVVQPSLSTQEEEISDHQPSHQDGSDDESSEPRAAAVTLNQDKMNLRDVLDTSLEQLELCNLHLTAMDLMDIYEKCPCLTHFTVRDCTLDRNALLRFLPRSIQVLDLSNNVWVTDSWIKDLLQMPCCDTRIHVFVANCASISRLAIARLNMEYQGRVVIHSSLENKSKS